MADFSVAPNTPGKTAIARIYKGNTVVGAGFWVEGGYLLTCAHVIRNALALKSEESPLGRTVKINFPYASLSQKLTAEVLLYHYDKSEETPDDDIAGLRVLEPLPAAVCPARVVGSYQFRNPYQVLGFPKGHAKGIGSYGQLREELPNGLVQMEDTKAEGVAILPGFSGTPVWDETAGAVVGMVVAREKYQPEARIGFMVTGRRLLATRRELESLGLLALLSDVAEALADAIKIAYRLCCPQGWEMPESLEGKLASLQDVKRGDRPFEAIDQLVGLLSLPDLTPDADLRESLQSWVQQRVGDIQPLLDEAQRLWNQYQATQITDAPSHLLIYVKDESTRMSDSLSSTDRLSLIKLVNALMQPDFESLVFAIKAPTYLIPSNFSAQGNRSAALLQWVESPGGCGLSEFLAVLKEVAPGAFKVTAVPSPTQPASPTPKAQSKKTPMSSPSSRPIRIFLAHAQEDKQKVFELYDRLKKQGYQPWLDKKDLLPGQRWREEIPKAIKNSDIFLACLSEIAVAKQGYVQREFRMALNACADRPSGTIYLIPLRFDDCRIPELRQEEYGISLWDYHWLDYFEADGFARLIQSIEVHFPGSPPAQRVEEMAPQASSFQADLGSDISLDMVHIPGGEFMMGSPQTETGRHDREGPQHEVTVPNLYMGKYPVTQAQWRAVSLRDRVQRELKPHPSEFNGDNLPVEQVTWFEAVEFCDRLSKHTGYDYRLPSEAEWAYACRARTTSPYSFGDTISTDQVNYDAHYKRTTEVGRFPPPTVTTIDETAQLVPIRVEGTVTPHVRLYAFVAFESRQHWKSHLPRSRGSRETCPPSIHRRLQTRDG